MNCHCTSESSVHGVRKQCSENASFATGSCGVAACATKFRVRPTILDSDRCSFLVLFLCGRKDGTGTHDVYGSFALF
jgi:hypothetical protein